MLELSCSVVVRSCDIEVGQDLEFFRRKERFRGGKKREELDD
jgi:hypothetical protein